MVIAVTGAGGHIGVNLVHALLADPERAGHRIRVLVHTPSPALEGLDVERMDGDVLDPESLARFTAGADVVYHLAAHITLDRVDPRAEQVNVQGTRNVVSACKAAGVRRLVHFSSIHALSPYPLSEVVDETRKWADEPDTMPYDLSKASGERAVLAGVEAGLDAVIVNPTGVLGPRQYRPTRQTQLLLDLHRRKMPALVDGGFNWVDVRDVVAGALAAERRGRTGERYLLSGEWRSLRELAQAVQDVTGTRAPRITVPHGVARLGVPFAGAYAWLRGKPPVFTKMSLKSVRHHRHISSAKAERELGYQARPFHETIRDTFAWYREAGLMA